MLPVSRASKIICGEEKAAFCVIGTTEAPSFKYVCGGLRSPLSHDDWNDDVLLIVQIEVITVIGLDGEGDETKCYAM